MALRLPDSLSRAELFGTVVILAGTGVILWYLLPPALLAMGGLIVSVTSVVYIGVFASLLSDGQLSAAVPNVPVWVVFLLPVGISGLVIWQFDVQFSPVNGILFVALLLSTCTYWLVVPTAVYQHYNTETESVHVEQWPSIAIIIPAYNEEGYIGDCIESCLQVDYPSHCFEIVVVDDGSTDDTYAEAADYADCGVTVYTQENGGKNAALNTGIEHTASELIVCVDADSRVDSQSLRALVRRYESDPDTCAVAGNVTVDNTGSFVTELQSLEYIIGTNIFRRTLDHLGLVQVVPGCLGLFDRELVSAVGRYSDDTLTEDFDLTLSLLKQGKRVRYCGEALVRTEVPGTWTDLYKQRIRWFTGNVQAVLKHRNIFSDPGFGSLHLFVTPYILFSMVVIPILGVFVFGAVLWMLLTGAVLKLLGILALFILLQLLFCTLAILIEDEDLSLLKYAPLTIIGFKQFLDLILFKAAFDVVRNQSVSWTHPTRMRHQEEQKIAE